MCNFLRSIDLDPMEWSEARKLTGKPNPYVGEILDAGFSNCQAVLVLFTPDDEAKLLGYFIKDDDEKHERELTPQPRQNVIFEAGMAMAKFPDRTVLVQVGKIRPMSDISGLHILRLNNSTSSRQELAERLADAKCNVKIIGKSNWHTVGDFELKLPIAAQKDSPSSSHGIAERTNSRDAKNSEQFEGMRLYTNKLKDNKHNSIFSEVTKNTFPSSITRIKGAGEEALFLISFTEFVVEKDIIAYVKKLEEKGLELNDSALEVQRFEKGLKVQI